MITGRLTLSGVLGSSEVFAHSIAFRDNAATDLASAATALDALANGMTSVSGIMFRYSPQVRYTRARSQSLNLATGDVLETRDLPLTSVGQATVGSLPFEVSAVVSIRTGVASRSGRGRFYLPPPATDQITGEGIFTNAFVAGVISTLGGALTSYVDAAAGRSLGVLGRHGVAGGPLIYLQGVSVDVGNVPDAQRRRRNRQVEARTSLTLA